MPVPTLQALAHQLHPEPTMQTTPRLLAASQQLMSLVFSAVLTGALLFSISSQADEQHNDALNMAQSTHTQRHA
jgi:hypothetical protein